LYHLNNKNTILLWYNGSQALLDVYPNNGFYRRRTSLIVSIDADVAASGKVARAVIILFFIFYYFFYFFTSPNVY